MKPREKKPETVFRIIDRDTSEPVGSYSRAYCDEFDFRSAEEARSANCHGMFRDRRKYKIAKYRVTYELIEDDCDKSDPQPAAEGGLLGAMSEAMMSKWLELLGDADPNKSP